MKRHYIAFAVFITVAIAAIFLLLEKANVYAELDALKLIPHPEQFTELYLTDYSALSASLPKQILGGETVNFSFVIHNLESEKVTYFYDVYVVDEAQQKVVIDSQAVTLDTGNSKTISESYFYENPHSQTTIFIELENSKQSIHFFVPNK